MRNLEMKHPSKRKVIAVTAALLLLGVSLTSKADTRQQLLRCDDTDLEAGAYGQIYGNDYHGTDQVCGGDTLGKGDIAVRGLNGRLRVRLRGANTDPFVMYEVYFVPIGADPTTDKVMVGNILTDCNGNANRFLKDITRPKDMFTQPPVKIKTRVGSSAAGSFFFYSRGPWGHTDDGTCRPSTLNTNDGTATGTLNNPVLWGGAALFDGIQFVSGYATP
jgi:hypothetical protein|tara:strand:- start:145 stop:801 length:657 start_codon:yes stop_codon:yes gene_type:complete